MYRCFIPFHLQCHWAIFHPESVNTETQFSDIYWYKLHKWPTSTKRLLTDSFCEYEVSGFAVMDIV